MNYKIREIEIPLETAKLIEFEASTLCKIIECNPTGGFYGPDAIDNGVPLHLKREGLHVVVMERRGGGEPMMKKHKLVILKANEEWEFTPAYEPVLSRRGKFEHSGFGNYQNTTYYVFQV